MKNIILAICLIAIYSCGTSSNKKEILPEEEMVAILTDIHILEAKLNWLKTNEDSLKKIYNSLEREIYKAHEVEKDQYERSFEYYMSRPQKMENIYTVVVDSLNVLEQRLMVQVEEDKKLKEQKREERRKEREERRKKREAQRLQSERDQLK